MSIRSILPPLYTVYYLFSLKFLICKMRNITHNYILIFQFALNLLTMCSIHLNLQFSLSVYFSLILYFHLSTSNQFTHKLSPCRSSWSTLTSEGGENYPDSCQLPQDKSMKTNASNLKNGQQSNLVSYLSVYQLIQSHVIPGYGKNKCSLICID